MIPQVPFLVIITRMAIWAFENPVQLNPVFFLMHFALLCFRAIVCMAIQLREMNREERWPQFTEFFLLLVEGYMQRNSMKTPPLREPIFEQPCSVLGERSFMLSSCKPDEEGMRKCNNDT